MCVGIPILLNLDTLHCIVIAMSCIHASHDHADSFTVVVSVHPLFVVAFCFFPDRMLHGIVSNDEFFGCSSTILPGKLSRPLPTYRGTYHLFVFMLYASLSDALFESRILSTCFPKAKLYFCHLAPITFCLLLSWPCES
jgi:hypothetical protein